MQSPSWFAAETGNLEILRREFANGCDVNAQEASKEYETLLMQSVRNDQFEATQLLLQARADPNLKSASGWTAMDLAQMYSHSSICTMLQEAQARPSSPSSKGVGNHKDNTCGAANQVKPTPIYWGPSQQGRPQVVILGHKWAPTL